MLIYCDDNHEDGKLVYKEVAYNALSQDQKLSLAVDWKDTRVIGGVYNNTQCENEFISHENDRMCFSAYNEMFDLVANQKLVAVYFNTMNDALLGPIIVIVDPANMQAIGIVGRN